MSDEERTIDTREEDPNVEESTSDEIGTANTMRERTNESWVKTWLTLDGNRLIVTALLALFIFGIFVFGGTYFYQYLLTDAMTADTVETVFSTMISAIITGVTLVLTITQIVVSQENGPLGDQRERMSSTMDFRDYAEELTGSPTPSDPADFLRSIILESKDFGERLRESVGENDDENLRHEIDEFTDSLISNAEAASDKLDGRRFGSYAVVSAALDYNYSWKIAQIERIADQYQDELTEDTVGVLDQLKVVLTMFGPARQHVKTLYFEWELISLSQNILYLSVPSLIVAGFTTTYLGGSSLVGVSLGISNLIWVISAAFAISALPFLLLISYIARVATIAKRTLAIGPFILRDSQR